MDRGIATVYDTVFLHGGINTPETMVESDKIFLLYPINIHSPLLSQLTGLPEHKELRVIEESFSCEDKNKLILDMQETYYAYQLARNTIKHIDNHYYENVAKNFIHFMNKPPINEPEPVIPGMQSGFETGCLIIGNGPSVQEHAIIDKTPPNHTIFACVHALSTLKKYDLHDQIDMIGHIDVRMPKELEDIDQINATTLLIAPYTAHKFIEKVTNVSELLLYIEPVVWNKPFIEIYKGESPRTSGTIIHALLHTALLQSYQHISLLGIDGGFKTLEELQAYDPEGPYIKTTNINDEEWWTNYKMLHYTAGIEQIVLNNPQIIFINYTTGMKIKGAVNHYVKEYA